LIMQFDQNEINMIAESVTQAIKPMLFQLFEKNKKGAADILMNIDDLAAYMKVSNSFIYKLIGDKEIPHIKKGPKFLLFRKKEIDEWLDSYLVPALLPSQRMAKLGKNKPDQMTHCQD